MSSLGKFPDWSVFHEREVPTPVEIASPSSTISALLESRLADIKALKQRVVPVDGAELDALAQQAVYHAELALLLNEAAEISVLRMINDKMRENLKNVGLEVIDLQGKSFHEVPDYVDVIGWRHKAEFSAEVVDEVLEPIVLCDGLVMRRGRIIMGAPLAQKPENREITDSER
jgi:hypothetical protein